MIIALCIVLGLGLLLWCFVKYMATQDAKLKETIMRSIDGIVTIDEYNKFIKNIARFDNIISTTNEENIVVAPPIYWMRVDHKIRLSSSAIRCGSGLVAAPFSIDDIDDEGCHSTRILCVFLNGVSICHINESGLITLSCGDSLDKVVITTAMKTIIHDVVACINAIYLNHTKLRDLAIESYVK